MFAELSLKELQQLVRELRAYHTIAGFSRMKKDALIAELTARFILRDGAIYLKEEKAPAKAPAAKPRANDKADDSQLQRRMIKYFKGLSEKELASTMQHKIRQFEKLEGTDLSEMQTQLFNGLYVSFYS
jgi:hypothetical protein